MGYFPVIALTHFIYCDMKTGKILIIITCISLFIPKVYSQQVKVYGIVSDSLSGERLTGATVVNLKTNKGTTTNEYGYFSISCDKLMMCKISFSFIGYKTQILKFTSYNDSSLKIDLAPGSQLKGVEIVERASEILRKNETGVLRIPINQIKSIPMPGAESDILKAYQMMPGVKQGNEGSSSMLVRGGSPEQNLIVIDDVPLYYVNHLGGFVSVFNTDAIQSAELYKGGFPVKFGGRLSSVMNIKLREGNLNKHVKKADIGLISGKFLFEGPIYKDTSSYLISYRRFLYDLISRPVSSLLMNGISTGYYFYDFNLKTNFKSGKRDWLYFSIYQGNDKIFVKYKNKSQGEQLESRSYTAWGNRAMSLKWNHLFGSSVFSRLTASYTRYIYNGSSESMAKRNQQDFSSTYNFRSGIEDFNIRLDLEHQLNNVFSFNYGTGKTFHEFQPGQTEISDNNNQQQNFKNFYGNSILKANESFIYAETCIESMNAISFKSGLRYNRYQINDKVYCIFEPRIILSLSLWNEKNLKASYNKMSQTVHMLSNEGIGMPTDLWMPSTANIRPSTSDQFTLGYYQNIMNSVIALSVEAYYKQMNGIIAYKQGQGQIGLNSSWENAVESGGKGFSQGIEILAQKVKGKTTGWLGYTLSKANRRFEMINDGKEFPFRYDRRHEVSLVIAHKINEKIDVSAVWTASTGNAITLAIAKYQTDQWSVDTHYPFYDGEEEILYFGSKNSFRMKGYHRLDIGINFKKQKKRGDRIWTISIYNVYNRQNPYYYFYESKKNGSVSLKQLCLFPIMPSFSYGFSF